MVDATYPEWATARAPLILADPWVYGRPSNLLPQIEALRLNRDQVLRGMEIPKKAGIPFTITQANRVLGHAHPFRGPRSLNP